MNTDTINQWDLRDISREKQENESECCISGQTREDMVWLVEIRLGDSAVVLGI